MTALKTWLRALGRWAYKHSTFTSIAVPLFGLCAVLLWGAYGPGKSEFDKLHRWAMVQTLVDSRFRQDEGGGFSCTLYTLYAYKVLKTGESWDQDEFLRFRRRAIERGFFKPQNYVKPTASKVVNAPGEQGASIVAPAAAACSAPPVAETAGSQGEATHRSVEDKRLVQFEELAAQLPDLLERKDVPGLVFGYLGVEDWAESAAKKLDEGHVVIALIQQVRTEAGMPDHVLNLIAAERDAKSQRVTGFLVYDSSSPTTARASSSWTVATLEDALAKPREIVEMCKVAIGVSDKTPLVNASARGRAIR